MENNNQKGTKRLSNIFENFALAVTKATGNTSASIVAFLFVIIWAASGPIFHYSEN